METAKKRMVLRLIVTALCVFLVLAAIKYRDAVTSILMPFILGIAIAYLVNPVVGLIEKKGVGRVYAVAVVYTAFAVAVLLTSYLILPAVYREFSKFMDILPFYIYRAKGYLDTLYASFHRNLTPQMAEIIGNNIRNYQEVIEEQIDNMAKSFIALFEGLIIWVIAVVISFYLLKDRDYFLHLIRYMVPAGRRKEVYRIAGEINRVLTRYIRGQLIVALIVGALATAGFFIINLNFALLLGVITGMANIIPYFGPIIGGVLVLLLGLMDSVQKAFWGLAVVFVVQQLESGIITPKIVGDSVGIHPVFIIFSLFVAGRFFGIIGLFFAVPVAAIIKILAVYLFNKIV